MLDRSNRMAALDSIVSEVTSKSRARFNNGSRQSRRSASRKE